MTYSDVMPDGLVKKATLRGVRSELFAMKSDLLKWIIGAIGFQTLAILGAVFVLAKFLKPL